MSNLRTTSDQVVTFMTSLYHKLEKYWLENCKNDEVYIYIYIYIKRAIYDLIPWPPFG